MDNTVVNVALPRIRADLSLSTGALEWVATSYLLVFASLMIAGGRSADRYGRRPVLISGLIVFGLASLIAGVAPDAAVLISARAVQGLGAALILPAALTVLSHDVPPARRQVAVGVATAVAAAALALGPLVGGSISQYWGWHLIFLINLPAIAAAIALTLWALPRIAPEYPTDRLEAPALLLLGLALAGVTWLLIDGPGHGVRSIATVVVLGCTLAAAAGFAVAERHGGTTLDRDVFAQRVFTGSLIAQTLWGLGVNGVFFYTSLYLQDVRRLSPSRSGLMFLPLALVLAVTVPLVDPLIRQFGARATVFAGLALVAAGLCWISTADSATTVPELLPGLLLIGIGSALTIPLTPIALEAVRGPRTGLASSLMTAARELAGVFGIVLVGAIIVAREHTTPSGGGLTGPGFLGGYQLGLRVAAGLMLVGAVVAWTTLPRRTTGERTVTEGVGAEIIG